MAGVMPQRPTPTASTSGAAAGQAQTAMSASMVNSFRVAAVADRLAMHVRTGQRSDPTEFFNLCLSLARGIDYAFANNEVPDKAQDLPQLLKQVYQRKNEFFLQAAIMVLMISVKNACKSGWFLVKDADELINLANEIGKTFCNPGDISIEPSNPPPIISNILSRFFPQMKIGRVLASLEVKPGFEAFVVDFHIPKNTVSVPHEKIRLFVAQTDNISTSSCIINPSQVNFLLNGRGVERRTNVSMDNGPQFPTDVTAMLKYGTNLLQAIGNFTDVRIDQNMARVLREVGENVVDVIITADGSWKPVQESEDQTNLHDKTLNHEQQDGSEQYESAVFSNTQANIVDLTVLGTDENDAMATCETEDRKPFKDILQDYSVPLNLNVPSENYTSEAVQNDAPPIEDDFWSGILFPGSALHGSAAPSVSDSPSTNLMMTPVLTDAVSPVLNRQPVDVRLVTQAASSLPQSQFLTPSNLQLQPTQVGNSLINSEIGRPSIPRHVSRTPIAIQALPAQSQTPNSHQRPRTSLNSLVPNGASPVTSQTPMASLTNGFSVPGGEAERQQQLSRSIVNSLHTDMASSSMQHHSMPQNWDHRDHPYIPSQPVQQVVGLPANPAAYRGSSGLLSERQNSQRLQAPNQRVPQSMSQPTMMRPTTHFSPVPIQQGGTQGVSGQASGSMTSPYSRFMVPGQAQRVSQVARPPPAVPVQLQAPTRTGGSSYPATIDGLRTSMGEQMVQSMSGVDDLVELPSEQNWQPTGRMRGSLSGRAYSAALNQFMIQPTQPAQAARVPPDLTSAPSVPSQLQVLIANNVNSHGPPPPLQQSYPRTVDTTGRPGSLGFLPK